MKKMGAVNFYVLPEGLISDILSLTSPRDACRSSLVSSIFKSAADSDAVWEKFLPSDYEEIISRSVSPSPVGFSSKKDLYLRLCNHPILIDEGNKSFALEKCSGRKCYMVAARELSIICGDTPEYWRWISLRDSRFSDVAELVCVPWLEIHGRMDTRMLSMKTTYAAYFVFKFTEGTYGLDFRPVEVSVRFVRGEGGGGHNVYMDPDGSFRWHHQIFQGQVGQLRASTLHRLRFHSPELFQSVMDKRPPKWDLRFPALTPRLQRERQLPWERGDGWMEIEMGEFFNDRGEDGEVVMSLLEVKGGNLKSGLIIQGIELRPKEIK